MAWDLLTDKDEDMEYMQSEEFKTLDEDVKDKVKNLRPSGSAGSWNIAQRWQKSVQRKMLYGKSPYIKQHELDRMSLELDEPGLVERLYQDPGEAEKDQADLASKELPALKNGSTLRVKPSDDHKVHAAIAAKELVRSALSPQQEDTEGMAALMTHYKQHIGELAKVDPQTAKAIDDQLKQAMTQVMQQKQRQQQMKAQMQLGRPPQPMDQGAAAPPPPQPQGSSAPPQPMGAPGVPGGPAPNLPLQ
jgi:hypothetical protein